MAENIAPAIHSITEGRLTFKKSHLEYLDNPTAVDITFGPGRSILIHNPERRLALLRQLLGDEPLLDSVQSQVEFRLDSMSDSVLVDEQSRIRIPAPFLNRARLTEKGAKAYLIPRRRNGWIEVWSEPEFDKIVDDPIDQWTEMLNRVILHVRNKEH